MSDLLELRNIAETWPGVTPRRAGEWLPAVL
jgi:hypothetical protein